jgi:hypothetical protein
MMKTAMTLGMAALLATAGATAAGEPFELNATQLDHVTGRGPLFLDLLGDVFDQRVSPVLEVQDGQLLLSTFGMLARPAQAMNKSQLVDQLATRTDISKANAKHALEGFIQAPMGFPDGGDRVVLQNFGFLLDPETPR